MPVNTKIFVAVTVSLSIATVVFLSLYLSVQLTPVKLTFTQNLEAGGAYKSFSKHPPNTSVALNFTCLPPAL
jgi:hypothetical protein